MWPFSTPGSTKQARIDFEELQHQFSLLEQRFKVLEREHEDLHRAYRKIRGSAGGEAREASRSAPARDPGGNGEDIPRAMTKDELRKKFLTPGFATRPLDWNDSVQVKTPK